MLRKYSLIQKNYYSNHSNDKNSVCRSTSLVTTTKKCDSQQQHNKAIPAMTFLASPTAKLEDESIIDYYLDELLSNNNIVVTFNYIIHLLTTLAEEINHNTDISKMTIYKSVVSLARRMRGDSLSIRNLLKAIITRGRISNHCCTIIKTKDGRLQVDGNKRFPHVLSYQLFRWPFVRSKNDLLSRSICQHSFHYQDKLVCLNPFHYVLSSSVDKKNNIMDTLIEPNISKFNLSIHYSPDYNIDQIQPNQYNHTNICFNLNYTNNNNNIEQHPIKTFILPIFTNNNISDHSIHHHNDITLHSSDYHRKLDISSNINNDNLLKYNFNQLSSIANSNDHHISINSTDTYKEKSIPVHVIKNGKNCGLFTVTLPNTITENMIISMNGKYYLIKDGAKYLTEQHLPDSYIFHSDEASTDKYSVESSNLDLYSSNEYDIYNPWCTIFYYEYDRQFGDIVHIPKNIKDAFIDGYTNVNVIKKNSFRLSLARLNNITNRDEYVNRCITNIGKGICIRRRSNGNISIKCLSDSSIFINSYYMDIESNSQVGTVIHKVLTNVSVQVFVWENFIKESEQCFYNLEQAMKRYQRQQQQHLDLIYEKRKVIEEFKTTIETLRKRCIIRLSFVKGWGYYYTRKSITSTPCWIEMYVNDALENLDQLSNKFLKMYNEIIPINQHNPPIDE